MSEDYRTLKESFYRRRDYGHSEESDGPIIAAAGLNNPQLLRSLLDEAQQLTPDDRRTCVLDQVHSELLDRRWVTPLLRAIERRRNDNITLLLQAGADPNGIDRASQAHHARRFRRFCADRLDLSDFLIEVDPNTPSYWATRTPGRHFLHILVLMRRLSRPSFASTLCISPQRCFGLTFFGS